MLLVVMPFVTSSDALAPSSFLLLVAMPIAPSSFLLLSLNRLDHPLDHEYYKPS